MSKTITVIVPGADETAQAKDVEVHPGNTVADLFQGLGKDPGAWQAYIRTENGDQSLAMHEDLYARVGENQKVFLESAEMVVG